MNNKRRLISWILMIMMVLSLIPVSVSAADECDHAEYGIVSVLKEANCAEGIRGIGKFECVSCGHTWYAQYDGHNMVETTIDATCDSPAMVGEQCTICGTVGEATVVEGSEALDHWFRTLTDHEDRVDPTCEEGGVRVRQCRYCGEIKYEEREPYGHWWSWGNDEIVDADCENPSGIKQTCSDCGKTQIVPVEGVPSEPAKGHTPEAVEDVAPTCSEAGLTGKVVCSVCDKVINEGTEVPADATAHKAELVGTLKDATCEANGIGKYACEYCGANMGYKVIPASHDWELLEGAGKDATCAEDGEELYFCTVCGAEDTKVIEATGEHVMEETTIDATCDSPAMVGEQCTVCGAVGEATVVEDSEALGHDMVLDKENEDYVAATCIEGGLDTLKCSRCDYTETKETEALGHEWVDGDVVEADCVNAAGVEQFCGNDGCEETRVIAFEGELAEPAKGHSPEAVEDKAPTCKDPGFTGRVECSECGEAIDAGTEIPVDANAHSAVRVEVLKPATCTANGIGKYACEYCDANLGYKAFLADHEWGEETLDEEKLVIYRPCKNEDCDAIDIVADLNDHVHTYEAVVTEPTCTEAGYTTYTCACGDTYTADEVAVIAHTYEAVVTAPTCTEAGYTTYACACGDTYTADEVAVVEHAWDDGVVTIEPTANTEGEKTFTCNDCGATKTAKVSKLTQVHTHNYKAVVNGNAVTYMCSCGKTMF